MVGHIMKQASTAVGSSRQYTFPRSSVVQNVVDSRKAIEQKMIYLSEGNHAAGPPRSQLRRKLKGGITATTDIRGNKGVAAAKANASQRSYNPIDKGVYEPSSRQEIDYNVYQKSPRRNGLTPRNLLDDDAATPGTAKESSSSSKPHNRRDSAFKADQQQQRLGCIYGQSQKQIGKPISSIAFQREPVFACSYCGAKFHIKSLLGAHRRTHDDELKMPYKLQHRSVTVPRSSCRFCDRKFDLERTLHIHQMCYCKKISPQQRRKLGFTELLHEKKAPLPSFPREIKQMSTMTLTSKFNKQQLRQSKSVVKNVTQPERWR